MGHRSLRLGNEMKGDSALLENPNRMRAKRLINVKGGIGAKGDNWEGWYGASLYILHFRKQNQKESLE